MSRKTRSETCALLLGCLMITAFYSTTAHSQSRTLGKIVIKVTLNDSLVQNLEQD